jgi:5-methylcytosine-specific restriction endonuclease McrA
LGSKERLLEHFKKKVGSWITLLELRDVSGVIEFQRQIRMLRQEGWDIENKYMNHTSCYILNSLTKSETGKKRVPISRKTRFRILQRDNSICQRCGKTPNDGVKLHVDHKLPVDWGGSTTDDNLWTLCSECNEGKKAYYSDFDSEVMKEISQLSSGSKRLQEFIRRNYGTPLDPQTLTIISRTREWTRQVRKLREQGLFTYKIEKIGLDKKNWPYNFSPLNLTPITKDNVKQNS